MSTPARVIGMPVEKPGAIAWSILRWAPSDVGRIVADQRRGVVVAQGDVAVSSVS